MLDFILGNEIASYVKRYRGLVFLAVILTTISSLFTVTPAFLLQPFVDESMKNVSDAVSWKVPWIALDPGSWFSWHRTELVIVENVSPNTLLTILALVAVASILFKSATAYLGGVCAVAFSNKTVKSLRIDLHKKFVSLPLSFFHDKKSGGLIARATADVGVMQGVISGVLMGLIEYPLTALVFFVFLLLMNYKLTILVFILAPLIIGLTRLFGRKVKKHAIKAQDATADVVSAYQETLLCLKVIQGFFRGGYEMRKFRDLAEFLYKRLMRWQLWRLGLGPLLDVGVYLVLPGVLIAGKIYFNHSLGELMAMAYAFSRVYHPVKKLTQVNNDLRSLQGALKIVFGILNTFPAIRDRPGAKTLPRHKESIEFKRVNFGYSASDLVLKDISLRIRAGEMVAFVGSTGAGKTTLLDLLPRFYDVTGGSICIDGVDIREVTLKSLRRQIGIVNQEILLFHDTIENNIRYGKSETNFEEIQAAAKVANAHNFILSQPRGYKTVIGDQGALLSGGQRQRIAIARAILVEPAILILDEAASALDAESEKLVQKAIEKLHGTRTILVVAHRLSTIMKANRIYVLEHGRIIESGTLNELMSANGRFRQLYDMQFKNKEQENNNPPSHIEGS